MGTAIVTGASSGIGLEIARELAKRGYDLVLIARSKERLDRLAADLPTTAHVLTADLADAAARAELPQLVADLGVEPEILVNNAGFSTSGAVAAADVAEEISMLEVDVVAVADLCTRFVPGLVARRKGRVLNVASTAAFQPMPGQAGYAAAKAFVLSYTQALAGELRGTGVTATALCPGPVHTGFGDRAGFVDTEAEDAMPAVLWVEAPKVARIAVDGLLAGKRVVIPGAANRVAAKLSYLTPRRLVVPIIARGHPALKR
jgi:short-subunit dehydrogenase